MSRSPMSRHSPSAGAPPRQSRVRLISFTQELGDDRMSNMIRQIMALFDGVPVKGERQAHGPPLQNRRIMVFCDRHGCAAREAQRWRDGT